MKMKGQIDSVYPPEKEAKRKKAKKAAKKAAKEKNKKKDKKVDEPTQPTVAQNDLVVEPTTDLSQLAKEQDTPEVNVPEQPKADKTKKAQPSKKDQKTIQPRADSRIEPTDDTSKAPVVRASKNSQALAAEDRRQTMQRITKALILGEISQGEALKTLRIQVLGLKQEDFANLTGVSRKTLSENENNKGNYTADIVNKLFHPFGLKVGLLPMSAQSLKKLL